MTIKNVTVAGGGVLGSQIAYQTAFSGFAVTLYGRRDSSIQAAKKRIEQLRPAYLHDLQISDAQFDAGLANISYETDLTAAVAKANLVIESLPENLTTKQNFYETIADAAPKATIFASNSSTMLPSQFAKFTGRPAQFLNMHFANHIWVMNTAEIMGTKQTSTDTYQTIVQFARDIKMVPIEIKKEQPGYVLNSMLTPLMVAGMSLWAKGVADPMTIDKTWMIATGAPMGPFAIIDMIGLRTAISVPLAQAGDEDGQIAATITAKLKERLAENKLGAESGEGFYHYPNPEFQQKSFLS